MVRLIPARASARGEPHLLQRRAAEQVVGIAELFHHLEVVVAFHHGERDRLAGGLDRGGEIAALALELGRLQGAVNQRDRRYQLVEMTLGAELTSSASIAVGP